VESGRKPTRTLPTPTLSISVPIALVTIFFLSTLRNLSLDRTNPPDQPSFFRVDSDTSTANMKLNISYPANGSQKLIEIEDERKLRDFMEKRVRPTASN